MQVLRELELVTVTPAIAAERCAAAGRTARLIYNVSPTIAEQTGLQKAM